MKGMTDLFGPDSWLATTDLKIMTGPVLIVLILSMMILIWALASFPQPPEGATEPAMRRRNGAVPARIPQPPGRAIRLPRGCRTRA